MVSTPGVHAKEFFADAGSMRKKFFGLAVEVLPIVTRTAVSEVYVV